jgi:hypothetical protein
MGVYLVPYLDVAPRAFQKTFYLLQDKKAPFTFDVVCMTMVPQLFKKHVPSKISSIHIKMLNPRIYDLRQPFILYRVIYTIYPESAVV